MLMVNEFKKWLGLISLKKSVFSRKRGKHHFLFFPFFVLFSGIAHFCIQSLVPCENGIIVKNLYSGLYSFLDLLFQKFPEDVSYESHEGMIWNGFENKPLDL